MKYSHFYSFIIPCYNSKSTLKKCLDSILKQAVSDWEAICINDGSTDDTLEILQGYANVDSRFRIIDTSNGGVARARNIGLKAAKGKYIVFVDSDDWIEPDLISKCGNIDDSDLAIFGHRFIRNGVIAEENYATYGAYHNRGNRIAALNYSSMCSITSYACDKVFKREIITQNKLSLMENVKIGEDLEFVLRYILHCKSICFISDILYNYNWGNGVTGNHNSIWKKLSICDFQASINALHHLIQDYKYFNSNHSGTATAFLYWELRHRSYIKSILIHSPFLFRRKILSCDNFSIMPFLGVVSLTSIFRFIFFFCIKDPLKNYINKLKIIVYKLLK